MSTRKRRMVAPDEPEELGAVAPAKDIAQHTAQSCASSDAPAASKSKCSTFDALLHLLAEHERNKTVSVRANVTVAEIKAGLEWIEGTRRLSDPKKRAARNKLRVQLTRAVQATEEDVQAAAFEAELPPLAPQAHSNQPPAPPPPQPAESQAQPPTEPSSPPLRRVQLPPAPALPLPLPQRLSAVGARAPAERRQDTDGWYYTFAEFVEFYGAFEQDAMGAGMHAWQRAAPVVAPLLQPSSTTRHLASRLREKATTRAVALMDMPLSQWPSNSWAAWPQTEPKRRSVDDGRQVRLCTREQFRVLAIIDGFEEQWEHEWELLLLPEHQRNAVRDEARGVRETARKARAREAHTVHEAHKTAQQLPESDDGSHGEPSDDQLVMAVMGPPPVTESDIEETVVSHAFLQMAAESGFFNELVDDLVGFGLATQTSASTYWEYVDECLLDDLDPEMGEPRRKRRLTEVEFNAMFPNRHRSAAR